MLLAFHPSGSGLARNLERSSRVISVLSPGRTGGPSPAGELVGEAKRGKA
jgi:hypothetical protein